MANSGRITEASRAVERVMGSAMSKPQASAGSGGTRLSGITPNGNKIKFTPDQVQQMRLASWGGQTVGISFPSKPGDAEFRKNWASRVRNSDRRYIPDYNKGHYRHAPARSAPWHNPGNPNRLPFYLYGHGSAEGFAINVNTARPGRPPKYKNVYIDGRTHGQLVKVNEHFGRASAADPTRPLVYVSCEAGNPSGSLARDSARVVREAGHTGTAYAATGKVHAIHDDLQSWVGVEQGEAKGAKISGEFRVV
ncbi:hypothetical protein F4560_003186 [Saccharothrix ecbatanensis]|uniref:Uncharacterized protein n=1 Tax=Saccharothrix ecbatanensis TaxID=1105145 RepID=A0A7W9HJG5_9PSEU|nr:hypothetical protein [Saccharothrix ecbatanensis]MBB5803418.1 hypothetical protein [Saccharothrix ecbatanensis]